MGVGRGAVDLQKLRFWGTSLAKTFDRKILDNLPLICSFSGPETHHCSLPEYCKIDFSQFRERFGKKITISSNFRTSRTFRAKFDQISQFWGNLDQTSRKFRSNFSISIKFQSNFSFRVNLDQFSFKF